METVYLCFTPKTYATRCNYIVCGPFYVYLSDMILQGGSIRPDV